MLLAGIAQAGPRALDMMGGAPGMEGDDAVEVDRDTLAAGTRAGSEDPSIVPDGSPTGPDPARRRSPASDLHTPLRCDPGDCAAWGFDAPSDQMAGAAGVLYLLGDDGLTIRDGRFAEERYVADVRDLIGVTGGSDAIGSRTDPLRLALVRADAGGAVVATPDRVARIDRHGARRWTAQVTGWHVSDAATVGDEHVVLRARSPQGGGPFGRVSVLDLDDGTERWSRQVVEVYGLSGDLLFVAGSGGHIEALNLGDGRIRWQRPLPDRALVQVLGPVVHLGSRLPTPAPQSQLIDAATGTTPAYLDAPPLHEPIRVGTRVVALLGDPGADGVMVVVIERDGSPAWRRQVRIPDAAEPLPGNATADIALRDLGDGTNIDLEAGAIRTVLSITDGAVLARGPRDHLGREHDWRTLSDEGIAVRYLGGVLQVRGSRGTVVRVSGAAPDVVSTDPVVVLDGDRALGLRVDPSD